MNLALFDFDGTITNQDTYTEFLKYSLPRKKLVSGFLLLLPIIIAYKCGLVSGTTTRVRLSYFAFKGVKKKALFELGERYANTIIPKLLRPGAMERLLWHKEQNDKVVIVSASLDVYLSAWCKFHDLELICTKLVFDGPICTGGYINGDCTGLEKANRVLNQFNLDQFEKVYCYGDSPEDKELLALGTDRYFREFQSENPKYA